MVELCADFRQFKPLCSLLQGAAGEEFHAKAACLSSAPSKVEPDPTQEPPAFTALAAHTPPFGTQFCPQPLLAIKLGFHSIP